MEDEEFFSEDIMESKEFYNFIENTYMDSLMKLTEKYGSILVESLSHNLHLKNITWEVAERFSKVELLTIIRYLSILQISDRKIKDILLTDDFNTTLNNICHQFLKRKKTKINFSDCGHYIEVETLNQQPYLLENYMWLTDDQYYSPIPLSIEERYLIEMNFNRAENGISDKGFITKEKSMDILGRLLILEV